MPVQSKVEKTTTADAVIRGVRKRYGAKKVLWINGVQMTPDEIVARYEAHLAAIEKIRQARIAHEVALDEERAMRKPMRALTLGVKRGVWSDFGLDAFGDFGWKRPKKPGPKTVAAKLAGVEKRAARRRKS